MRPGNSKNFQPEVKCQAKGSGSGGRRGFSPSVRRSCVGMAGSLGRWGGVGVLGDHAHMVVNMRAMMAAPRASSPWCVRAEGFRAAVLWWVFVVARERSKRMMKTIAAAAKNTVGRMARSGEWPDVAAAVVWAAVPIAWWSCDIDIPVIPAIPPDGATPWPAVVI